MGALVATAIYLGRRSVAYVSLAAATLLLTLLNPLTLWNVGFQLSAAATLGMILLTIPIFFPVAVALGYDPIWFGVVIVLVTELGVITPPVGINVYVVSGIAKDVPLEVIFKGAFPFVLTLLAYLVIMIFFPQIALFLPSLAAY
jgi:TRAP-type C4-dicarboxylate transport system permease large subunit